MSKVGPTGVNIHVDAILYLAANANALGLQLGLMLVVNVEEHELLEHLAVK